MKCICCGQTIKAKKAKEIAPVSTADMSTEQLYKHYKKTAPVDDARFMLRLSSLTDAMRAELADLIATNPNRAEFYRRYVAVQDAWRELTTNAARRQMAA